MLPKAQEIVTAIGSPHMKPALKKIEPPDAHKPPDPRGRVSRTNCAPQPPQLQKQDLRTFKKH